MTPKKIISKKKPGVIEPRRQAKAKLGRQKQAAQPEMEADTQHLVHELEMQNEELVQTRAKLETAYRQYTNLYDFAPVGYFTLARNSAIRKVNLAGANLLGVERDKLIKRRFGVFVSTQSRTTFNAFLEKVFTNGSKETCEVTLQKDGSAPLWVHIEAAADEGQHEACHAMVVDITERKQTEQELRKLRKAVDTYRDLVENSQDLICTHDLKGRILSANPWAAKALGYEMDVILQMNIRDFLAPEVRREFEVYLAKIRKHGAAKGLLLIQTAAGERRIWEYNNTLRTDDVATPIVRGMAHDVTERKRAEKALEAKNRDLVVLNSVAIELASIQANRDLHMYIASKLKQITAAATATFGVYDMQKHEIHVERVELDQNLITDLIQILGGKKLTEVGFPVSAEVQRDLIQNPVRIQDTLSEVTFGAVSPMIGKIAQKAQGIDRFVGIAYVVDGELYGTSVLALRTDQPNPSLEMLQSFANLAAVSLKRKQAEEAQKQSEARYRLLADHMTDMIWLTDMNLKTTYISPSIERIRGFTLEELQQLPLDQNLTPASFQLAMEVFSVEMPKVMADSTYSIEKTMELEFYLKDGGTVWTESKLSVIRDENGNPLSILGEGRDITERKRTELQREVLYQVLRAVSIQLDSDLIARSAVETIARLTGYPHVCIALPDEDGTHWVVRGAAGSLAAELGAAYPIHQGVIGRAFKTGQAQWVRDILDDPNYVRDVSEVNAPALRSEFVALMHRDNHLLGALNIEGNRVDEFNDADARMMQSLADVILLALENARLYKEAQQEITERKHAEKQLRESEARFKAITSNTPDHILIQDSELRYSFVVNPQLGLTEEDMLGKTDHDFLSKEDADKLTKIKRQALETGKPVHFENSLISRAGEAEFFDGTYVPQYDTQGRVDGLIGYSRNITERKQAEKTLRAERDFSAQVMNAMGQGLTVTNAEGCFEYVNPAYARMIGRAPEELLGKSPQEYTLAADLPELERARARRLNSESSTYETHLCHADGHEVPVLITGVPRLRDGKVAGAIAVITDITERVRAEEEISRMALMLDTAPNSITVHDFDGHFLFANQKTFDLHGFTRDEFLALNLHQLNVPDSEKLIAPRMQELLDHNEATFESFHYRKDGSILPLEVNTRITTWSDKKVILSVATDITERKRAEETLRESEKSLREAQRLAHIGDWQWALATDTVKWSDELYHINGRDPNLPAPSYAEMPSCYTPESWERLSEAVTKALQSGESYELDLEIVRPDGATRHTSAQGETDYDASGKIIGLHGTVQDITERKRVEKALRESESRLSLIFNNTSDLQCLVEISAGIPRQAVAVNRTYLETCRKRNIHLTEKDMLGQDWAIFLAGTFGNNKEAIEAEKQRYTEAIGTGQPIHYEIFLDIPGGKLYAEVVLVPVYNDAGICCYVLWSARDITERKQAEEALRESEERFRMLFDKAPLGYQALNFEGCFIDVNQAWLDTLGYTRDEVLGHWFGEFLAPQYVEAFRQRFPIFKAAGQIHSEFEMLHKNGSRRFVAFEGRIGYELNGDFKQTHCILQDITERKRAEEEVKNSEKRFHALIENGRDNISLLAVDGTLLWESPSVDSTLGYTPNQFVGHNIFELMHPDDQVWTRSMYMQVVETPGSTQEGSFRLLHAEGTWRWIECSATNLLNEPSVQAIVINYRDITERKQAEEKLQTYSEKLEEMVGERTRELRETQEQLIRQEKLAVLGQLAGGVGHELRNPLAVINNAVYYLKLVQPDVDEKIREYLSMIERETHTAEKIITDLLDFARIKSMDREQVSVSELAQRVLERYPAPASVMVLLDFPSDLPPIYADLRQMEQVLGNLVVNACQAMRNGGKLTIESRWQEEMIAIAVKDTGTGISPENMKKLFEPLFTTKTKGIGLGLAVSKKLVEANGGRIEVQSEPGTGSTFTLWLPLKSRKQ